MNFDSQREKFLVVLGLSRSGTTLLTTMFHAHPDIELRFEAWHSVQPRPPIFSSLNEFDSFYGNIRQTKEPKAKITGFKETFGEIEALDWVESVLSNINIPIKIVVIVRDIAEVYLSDISGYRKYWGQPNREISSSEFIGRIIPATIRFKRMIDLQKKYGGSFVSYKRLSLDPKYIFSSLSSILDVPYDESQLDFHNIVNKNEIMGDLGLVNNPQPVSKDLYINRADEAKNFIKSIEGVSESPGFKICKILTNYIDEVGYTDNLPQYIYDELFYFS